MSDTYILSFDPGKSSGVALGILYPEDGYHLIASWQVEGGLSGLQEWVQDYSHTVESSHHVISEKFTPLQNKGFGLTMDSVEPLRCEGMLVGLGVMEDYPNEKWRRPNDMYLYGGANLVEKKKRGRQFLKDHGMYRTGNQVGCKDSNDATSATWHGISYAIKVLGHKPTFDMVSDWIEKQG